jgi:hypothetical protein
MVYTLIETIVVLIILILVEVMLLKNYFRDNLIAFSTILLFILSIWAIPTHNIQTIFEALSPLWGSLFYKIGPLIGEGIRQWVSSNTFFFLLLSLTWFLSLIGIIGYTFRLIRKNKTIEERILSFVERLTVLSTTILFVDIICIIIILIRNTIVSG